MRRVSAVLLCATVLASCSIGRDLPAVNAAVSEFHRQLNAQAFDAIYADSSPDFKHASTAADFAQLLSAIHRKLGDFQTGATGRWVDNVNTSGHFLTLDYAAKYEHGDADENFVYRVDGAKVTLAGYHIASNALITN